MYVSDTELSVPAERCYAHTKTKRKARLSDGQEHPVKVTKLSKEEINKLWNSK